VSELSLDPPLLTAGAGNPVLTLAEEPEHERVRPVNELRHDEGLLDSIVAVEDDGKLGAHPEAEDVAKLFSNVREGFSQIEEIQKWKVAEDGEANRTRRKALVPVEQKPDGGGNGDGGETAAKVDEQNHFVFFRRFEFLFSVLMLKFNNNLNDENSKF
jgi:hypothetical protein